MGRRFGQKNQHGHGVEACGMGQARRRVSRGPPAESCPGWGWREKPGSPEESCEVGWSRS